MRTSKGRKVKYTKLSDEKQKKINPTIRYLDSLESQPNKRKLSKDAERSLESQVMLELMIRNTGRRC